MNKTLTTIMTVCALGAMATPVAAQEAGEWMVRAGYWNVAPKSDNGEVIGAQIDVDSGASLGFNFTYMITDQFAVELLAAAPFSHDISLSGLGEVGETKHLPPTLSAQYHFPVSNATSVYAGLGVNYTLFFEEETRGAIAGTDLELDGSLGLAAQVGIDYRFSDRYFLNLDVRWIDIDTDAEVTGDDMEPLAFEVQIDPIVIGLNLGVRF